MKNKRVLFGTDGVRDVANRGGMTPEMALRLGRVFILFLAERGVPRPRIVLGRDTRRSDMMLEGALSAGMTYRAPGPVNMRHCRRKRPPFPMRRKSP